ncbi:thiamine-phosphate kinase [Brevibacterium casei]|uniref:thiamine-phosphate kinase n=1 Tax=Brevibacterium casei TaxID=33889 RepID=UPI0021AF39D9|nr:thiamine-phosphate kinase [Brevibacterium casei]MCT1447485.1 thiamine-phosphate kinase [Brevibacterium casei]
MTRLSDLGESEVLRRLLAHRRSGAHEEVGPGDDAAVTKITGRLVSTADMLVENEDFTRDWLDWSRLGTKAAAQNLADVCAMGARPHGLLVSLAVPDDTDVTDLEALFAGIVAEAERAGRAIGAQVPIIGGDLSSSGLIVTAITALGAVAPGEAVTRAGARPGDEIWLAGTLGRSAAGLDLLFAGAGSDPELPDDLAGLIGTQLAPQPDYAAIAHRPAASAMIDVSDGLSTDLGRIAEASGVRADIDRAALEDLIAALRPAARYVLDARGGETTDAGIDELALHWVLDGGEDHGFVASAPVSQGDPVGWRRIGEMQDGSGVSLDGAPVPTSGFSHFGK